MNPQSPGSDEISLVDLAVLLVRRWKLLLSIFLIITVMATTYAMLQPTQYRYTSLYRIAEHLNQEGVSEGLVSANAVLTQVQTQTLPAASRAFLADRGLESMPFRVNVSQPSDTQLIALHSETTEAEAESVETLHQMVFENIQAQQAKRTQRQRQSLARRLEGNRTALENASGESAAGLVQNVTELEARLAALEDGEISQVAVRSVEPQSTSPALIITLGLVLGTILAVLGVFLWHFTSIVRRSLKDER